MARSKRFHPHIEAAGRLQFDIEQFFEEGICTISTMNQASKLLGSITRCFMNDAPGIETHLKKLEEIREALYQKYVKKGGDRVKMENDLARTWHFRCNHKNPFI